MPVAYGGNPQDSAGSSVGYYVSVAIASTQASPKRLSMRTSHSFNLEVSYTVVTIKGIIPLI